MLYSKVLSNLLGSSFLVMVLSEAVTVPYHGVDDKVGILQEMLSQFNGLSKC
jgi:hypothetical protein